jgi:hypothetical protein
MMWRLKIYKSAIAIILIISAPYLHIMETHVIRYPMIYSSIMTDLIVMSAFGFNPLFQPRGTLA